MAAAAAAAASEGEEGTWWATTNWIVGKGSLHDSISYDTSTTPDDQEDAAAAATVDLLLLRPEGDDPPPCEITICFRQKHEIHRVYVRSTARIYEIYYASEHKDSSTEYLCTVRCGAVEQEVIPKDVTDGATFEYQGSSNGTAAGPRLVLRSDSNTSDEDGWVQVKSPDSLMQDDKEYTLSKRSGSSDSSMDNPKMQVHFEATAEISDSNPCVSLTLRLLSIQTKDCVHVEEIYVYADLDESSNFSDLPISTSENTGGSSLLAMLAPTLMQLSKSGTTQDKLPSSESTVLKYQYDADKTAHSVSPGIMNTIAQDECSCMSSDQKSGLERKETGGKAEKVQMPNSLVDQHNNQAYDRIEKVLDELVLKVGRVEDFCLKFEEKMLKPLSCMEERLQQLEHKLDALAVKPQSSKQCDCSRISAPEFNESDSENEDCNSRCTKSRERVTFMGAMVQADNLVSPIPEYQTRPGLVIKAPEFLIEDDESSNADDTIDQSVEDLPQINKPSSMESVLASSLAAFLSSTTVKSPEPTLSQMDSCHESVNGDISVIDSLVCIPSEVDGSLPDKSVFEENGSDLLDAARGGACFGDSSSLPTDPVTLNMSDIESDGMTSNDKSLVANAEFSPISGSIVTSLGSLNEDINPNCDDILSSLEFNCGGNQESTSIVKQADPLLGNSMPSRMVPSPISTVALFYTPSLYRIDSNELSASIAPPPSEVVEYGESEVNMQHMVSISPPEVVSELADHEWNNWFFIKTSDELFPQSVLNQTSIEVNQGGDNTTTSSSLLGNLIEPTAETETLAGGSSKNPASTINDYTSGNKMSEVELGDMICNVKFVSDTNWTSELPLEVLLGEMQDVQVVESVAGIGEELLAPLAIEEESDSEKAV